MNIKIFAGRNPLYLLLLSSLPHFSNPDEASSAEIRLSKFTGNGNELGKLGFQSSREVEWAEKVDGAMDEQNGNEDQGGSFVSSEHCFVESSEWSLDDSPLDKELLQLAKDRRRAEESTACLELFASICTSRPDLRGGRMIDAFDNDF